jgi:hypothetical protein
MKMIMLMMVIFFVTGALSQEITRWTTVTMTLLIVMVLAFTRLTF